MWDASIYPRTRFTSEYGVQSLPSMLTLQQVAKKADLVMGSDWMNWRQHQAGGYEYLLIQIPYNLPKPTRIKEFIYYSQVQMFLTILFYKNPFIIEY